MEGVLKEIKMEYVLNVLSGVILMTLMSVKKLTPFVQNSTSSIKNVLDATVDIVC